MEEKVSIVLFSGTIDKLIALATLATGASALGKEVNIFLTFWGVMAFRKDDWRTNTRFSKDYEDYRGPALEAIAAKNIPSWMTTLEGAIEVGDVKIRACGATMDMFDLKLEDLEPVVSEITGVVSFFSDAEGGQILFI